MLREEFARDPRISAEVETISCTPCWMQVQQRAVCSVHAGTYVHDSAYPEAAGLRIQLSVALELFYRSIFAPREAVIPSAGNNCISKFCEGIKQGPPLREIEVWSASDLTKPIATSCSLFRSQANLSHEAIFIG